MRTGGCGGAGLVRLESPFLTTPLERACGDGEGDDVDDDRGGGGGGGVR